MRNFFVSLCFAVAIIFSLSPVILAQSETERSRLWTGARTPPPQGETVARVKGMKRASTTRFTPPAKSQLPQGWEQKGMQKPASLPMAEKQRMMGGTGAMNVYATLSLMNPTIAGRAEVTAWNPVMVSSGSGGQTLAMFTNLEWSALGIKINAEAPQSLFLVDCTVDTFGTSQIGFNSYSVSQQGEAEQTLSSKGGHVLFLLDAPAPGWYEVSLRNSVAGWVFHQCEVTSVK
jgi:hypothetical protein